LTQFSFPFLYVGLNKVEGSGVRGRVSGVGCQAREMRSPRSRYLTPDSSPLTPQTCLLKKNAAAYQLVDNSIFF